MAPLQILSRRFTRGVTLRSESSVEFSVRRGTGDSVCLSSGGADFVRSVIFPGALSAGICGQDCSLCAAPELRFRCSVLPQRRTDENVQGVAMPVSRLSPERRVFHG